MDLCVDCNLLFAELEKHDFRSGFSAVVYGVFNKCQVDYWHRGDFVCCIKSEGMIATSVFFVIGNELRDDFTTYSSIIKFLDAADHLDVHWKPSILKTFENVLFTNYSDAVVKYKEMLTVFPKFTPAFKELFAEEMDALVGSNTQIQIKPDLSKIYISEEHEYCYIVAASPDSVYMKRLNNSSFGSELDYRELQKFTIDPEAFNELHSLLLTALHDLSSVIRVDNLPKANGESIKYYNESDHMNQSYTIASPNFQMRLYALIGVSCHLTDNSRTINPDKKCQASDITDIFSGYNNNTKCIHDFLVSLMKAFAPILLGDLALRKQLFDYLYTLEDGNNSVNAQQELPGSKNIGSLPASEQSTSIDFASFACEPEDFTHGSIFTEPLYYFLNLSSDADYKKYSAKLKDDNVAFSDEYSLSTELSNNTKINLCDQISEVFLHTRIPIIFVVDSFSVLQDNTDWVNKRSDLLDGVMDKEGTTKFLKDIVSEQSPSAIII
jgi:hypothetical protein